ncbi:MAG TPA: hypothetical protein VIT91_05115 [Chthoniobacterales bacterium]
MRNVGYMEISHASLDPLAFFGGPECATSRTMTPAPYGCGGNGKAAGNIYGLLTRSSVYHSPITIHLLPPVLLVPGG